MRNLARSRDHAPKLGSGRRDAHAPARRRGRRLQIEPLEPRWLMSGQSPLDDLSPLSALVRGAEADLGGHTELATPDWLIYETPQAGGGEGIIPLAASLSYTLRADGLPLMNTRPGAAGTIFLDFDGDTYRSMAPYSEDADATTFNATEQANIIECVRQIDVYYAMFDLTVTTVQPNVSTTPTAWEVLTNTISGGYSYVGVYPNTVAQSFNTSGDARSRTSGITHEIGHNFGLSHTSTYDLLGNKTAEYAGKLDDLHGPLMGVDYAGVLHKWTWGHPSSSPSTLQDDMARIASEIKDNARGTYTGDGYRPDDFGGTIATATPLTLAGTSQSTVGIIERLNDADAFSFLVTTAGRFNLSLGRENPSFVDLKLSVYDSAGNLVLREDGDPRATPMTMVNDQHVSVDLANGTYYAIVQSHGNYADQGQYILRVDPLPDGWRHEDIGLVGWPGYAGYDEAAGTFTVAGSGGDIWGTSDTHSYAFQQLQGDGSIIARVDSLTNTGGWAKVGLMFRESLAADSKHAAIVATPSNGTQWLYRSSTGGSTSGTNTGGAFAPVWLRLTRTGNTFRAYTSSNGTSWTQFGSSQTISMASKIYVGLAVDSNNNSKLNTTRFSNVSLTGTLNPGPTLNALAAPTGLTVGTRTASSIALSWTDGSGETGYAIERSSDGVNFAEVGTTSANVTTYTATNLSSASDYFFRIRARDATGVSMPSAAVRGVTRAGAVTGLTVTSWTNTALVLNWTEASGETGYRIERSTDGTNWTSVGTAAANSTSFTNTGLTAATQYYYRVVTLDAEGDAATATSTAAITRLPAVTGLTFTERAVNRLTFTWTDLTTETGYRLERSTDGETYTTVTTLAANVATYSDTTVSPLSEYYYRVVGLQTVGSYTTESVNHGPFFTATPATAALPGIWLSQDIGTVGGVGAAGHSGGVYTILAAGADIWGTADEFRFVYQTLVGDGSITARVSDIEATDDWAKGGVMIRESLTAGSKYAIALVTPTSSNTACFQYRTSTGGNAGSTTGAAAADPYWVRLTRAGNTLTAYSSPDGATWTQIGSRSVTMASQVYIGLAVTSHDDALLSKSTFDNVTVSNAAPTVATAARATPSPVTATTTSLSVVGADDHGEPNLTYTWSVTASPPGAATPTFTVNGSNAAKTTTATFSAAGSYTFLATLTDSGGLTTTSSVTVVVNQTLTTIVVAPASVTVATGQTQQFAATAKDQFGAALMNQPAFTWSATAGSITTAGLYTAPAQGSSATITAASGGKSGTATATLVSPPHIVSWQSANDHGRGVGEAALLIPDDGTFSEPREGGVRRLLVTFDKAIDPASLGAAAVQIAGHDAANQDVDLSSLVVTTAFRNGNTTAVISLSTVLPDVARYLVRLVGIADAAGVALAGDNDRILTALRGDMSGDRLVDAADLAAVNAQYTGLIMATNAAQVRADLSLDGQVSVNDLSRSRAQQPHDARTITDPTLGGALPAAAEEPLAVALAAPAALEPAPTNASTTAVPATSDAAAALLSTAASRKAAAWLFAEWSDWLGPPVRKSAGIDDLASGILETIPGRRRAAVSSLAAQRFSW